MEGAGDSFNLFLAIVILHCFIDLIKRAVENEKLMNSKELEIDKLKGNILINEVEINALKSEIAGNKVLQKASDILNKMEGSKDEE